MNLPFTDPAASATGRSPNDLPTDAPGPGDGRPAVDVPNPLDAHLRGRRTSRAPGRRAGRRLSPSTRSPRARPTTSSGSTSTVTSTIERDGPRASGPRTARVTGFLRNPDPAEQHELSHHDAERPHLPRRASAGFTLVEMIVVTLLLLIAMLGPARRLRRERPHQQERDRRGRRAGQPCATASTR